MWQQLQASWSNLMEKLLGWFDGLILILPNLMLSILVMVLAYFLSRYIQLGVKRLFGKITSNGTIIGVLSNIATTAFLMVMLFVVLGILDLDKALTSLLAGAGVVGLAVGLALQDPMVNFFSGVLMSVRDYYKVGDLIESNGFFGTISKINLRSTVLLKPDGQEVILPNKDVIQNALINYSHNGRRRVDISCGIAYGDDLEKVKTVATGAIQELSQVDPSRPVEFFYTGFGDSSINFELRFWQRTTGQADFLAARSQGIIALKKAFDAEGITIPFPIRTLDFGVVGGKRLDDLYPVEQLEVLK